MSFFFPIRKNNSRSRGALGSFGRVAVQLSALLRIWLPELHTLLRGVPLVTGEATARELIGRISGPCAEWIFLSARALHQRRQFVSVGENSFVCTAVCQKTTGLFSSNTHSQNCLFFTEIRKEGKLNALNRKLL